MIKVCIIGGGNVAFHLTRQFLKAENIALVQLYNRSLEAIIPFKKQLDIINDISKLADADVYIIATSDNAIQEVSKQIPSKNSLVVHTSGSISMESLSHNNRKGVFYPLQSLSKSKEVDFSEIPICIEAGNEKDLQLLEHLASSLTQKIYKISSEQRQYLHVAAVFVNNFVNHLYYIGNQICKDNHISFEILYPLIQETAHKIKDLDPKSAQTGPAKRNDTLTIENHLKLLSTKEKELYQLLTSSIKDIYEKTL
ncbi:MAG: DUF2520 domain-containing protein [Flavobacteriaceae bacterium]|nr:DUF2520 domain-containing protein [Flavobacteriaceae bacterium]